MSRFQLGVILLGVLFILIIIKLKSSKEEGDSVDEKGQDAIDAAKLAFQKLRKPVKGRLNERQVLILLGLAHAGEHGLLMQDIMCSLCECDESNLEMTKFEYDWCRIWQPWDFAQFRFGPSERHMISSPCRKGEGRIDHPDDPFDCDLRYFISLKGFEYLKKHKFI